MSVSPRSPLSTPRDLNADYEEIADHYFNKKQNCCRKFCIFSCFSILFCCLKLIKVETYKDNFLKKTYKLKYRSCRYIKKDYLLRIDKAEERIEEIDRCCTKTFRIKDKPPEQRNSEEKTDLPFTLTKDIPRKPKRIVTAGTEDGPSNSPSPRPISANDRERFGLSPAHDEIPTSPNRDTDRTFTYSDEG